jgi:ubiquinone/menaquinone biosynthesis C-methylase UbiE
VFIVLKIIVAASVHAAGGAFAFRHGKAFLTDRRHRHTQHFTPRYPRTMSKANSAHGLSEHEMTGTVREHSDTKAPGLVLHHAELYDITVWLMTLGREREFREKILCLVRLKPGDAVLDVGCGTGSLAIAAKRHVGPTGIVNGVDASAEMLARAVKKTMRAGADVAFEQATAQALPFSDARFDVVFSTVMLHHLSHHAREECVREMRRVLQPGGSVVVVDFAPQTQQKGFLRGLHRHGHVKLEDIIANLEAAGLKVTESGALGYRNLQFALATAPSQI